MLPTNPQVLYSYLNTKLRDTYSSLEDLCDDLECSYSTLLAQLEHFDMYYDQSINQIRLK